MAHPVIKYLEKELQNKGSIIITPKIGKELVDYLKENDTSSSASIDNNNTKLYKKVINYSKDDILDQVSTIILDKNDIINTGNIADDNTVINIHDCYIYVHSVLPYTIDEITDTIYISPITKNQNIFEFPITILNVVENKLFKGINRDNSCENGQVYKLDWIISGVPPADGESNFDLIIYYSIIDHG